MIVAVPGSVGALDADQVDMSTLLAQENPGIFKKLVKSYFCLFGQCF